MADKYEALRLKNQLCFPLYACSKEIINHYKPVLDDLDLTYTQYITMMVLWEKKQMNVKELGSYLYLDSGTLTPVLKKLESKHYIERSRDKKDERVLNVTVTPEGEKLQDRALCVPGKMAGCMMGALNEEEAATLYTLLYKVIDHLHERG
ncbi:MAG: MarR family transcriptional regulator [Lachnospiraceae bacterium]|nr:MarR family transcriptional regulator [Lachnospiraceae bacterium]